MKLTYLSLIFSLLLACGIQNPTQETTQQTPNNTKVSSKVDSIHEEIATVWPEIKEPAKINCRYDNDVMALGEGLAMVPNTFRLFDDSTLTVAFKELEMYAMISEDEGICAKFHDPEYSIMSFVCLKKTDKFYQVLVSFSDIKYLPVKEGYRFVPWSEYILHSFGIRRKTIKAEMERITPLPIYTAPLEQSDTIKIPDGHELLCPMEVKGDWVKVQYDCFYNKPNNANEGEPCHSYIQQCESPLTGWTKWRKENDLLVDIMIMP